MCSNELVCLLSLEVEEGVNDEKYKIEKEIGYVILR